MNSVIKKLVALLICVALFTPSAFAQIGSEIGTLDSKHFIPPIYARSGLDTVNDIRTHELHLSTDSAATITITVSDFSGALGTIQINDMNPAIVGLSGQAHTDPLTTTTLPLIGAANYGSKGIVDETGSNTADQSNGLVLEGASATERFYANLRHKAGSQGASLTAKGHTAIGTDFRTGAVISQPGSGGGEAS